MLLYYFTVDWMTSDLPDLRKKDWYDQAITNEIKKLKLKLK